MPAPNLFDCPFPVAWVSVGAALRQHPSHRTYVFAAIQARRHVAAQAVRRIVDWLCNGSIEEVLVGMVDSAMLDPVRLEQPARKVADEKRRTKRCRRFWSERRCDLSF